MSTEVPQRSPPPATFREHIAYHEAGHALMWVLLGKPFDEATIEECTGAQAEELGLPPHAGRVTGQYVFPPASAPSYEQKTALLGALAIGWGGLIGEVHSPHWNTYKLHWSWKHDQERNRVLIRQWYPQASQGEEQTLDDEGKRLAYQLMGPPSTANVGRLKRLAEALLQDGSLTYDQATHLLEQEERNDTMNLNPFRKGSDPSGAAPTVPLAQPPQPGQTTAAQPPQPGQTAPNEKDRLAHEERMEKLRQKERRQDEKAKRVAARSEQFRAIAKRGVDAWQHRKQPKEPLDHFEQIRRQIEKFDEEKRHPVESAVIFVLTLLAYVGPTVVALFIGQEIGDAYGGPWAWGNAWSMGTHVVAWIGELAQAMFVVAIATAARRQVSDPEYRSRLIWSVLFFGVFIAASGLAQWFVASGHLAALHLQTQSRPGQVALGFRVGIPAIFDIGSALYLAIMKVKTQKRYLAEQAQKAEAIEQLNKSHLRVQEAQEGARRDKEQHDQYLTSLKASQELVNEMQRLIAESMLKKARRGLADAGEEDNLVDYVPSSNGYKKASGSFRPHDPEEAESN